MNPPLLGRYVGLLHYKTKYKHFCNEHAIQNTVIHMYGIPVYDKT